MVGNQRNMIFFFFVEITRRLKLDESKHDFVKYSIRFWSLGYHLIYDKEIYFQNDFLPTRQKFPHEICLKFLKILG